LETMETSGASSTRFLRSTNVLGSPNRLEASANSVGDKTWPRIQRTK
jgi:hypothetical protein